MNWRFQFGGRGAVLWRTNTTTCFCLTLATDHIEISLVVDGVLIDQRVFSSVDAASEYVDRLRVDHAV